MLLFGLQFIGNFDGGMMKLLRENEIEFLFDFGKYKQTHDIFDVSFRFNEAITILFFLLDNIKALIEILLLIGKDLRGVGLFWLILMKLESVDERIKVLEGG